MLKKYTSGIGICIISILLYLGIGMFFSLFISDSVTLTIITDILISILGVIYYRKSVRTQKIHECTRLDNNLFWKLFGIVFVVWTITQVTVTWYYNSFGDKFLDRYNSNISKNVLFYLFLTLLFAPASEEILMRGVIYPTLKKICRPYIAALLSSIIFAAMHGTIVHMIIGIYCGIFFVLIYEYTGHIRYSILVHMIYNTLSVFFGTLKLPGFFFTSWFVIMSNCTLIISFIVTAFYFKHSKSRI